MNNGGTAIPGRAASNKLAGVQILRGWAASIVAMYHLCSAIAHASGMPLSTGVFPSEMGVDIFFTISGFIMTYTCYDWFGQPGVARRFMIKRLIRIVPLYWLFTMLTMAALILWPSAFSVWRMSVGQTFASFLFIPYRRYDGVLAPLMSLGWTLNYEMLFYSVFAVALLFPVRRGLTLLFGVFVVAMFIGELHLTDFAPVAFWTKLETLEFLLGVVVALIWRRKGAVVLPLSLWVLLMLAANGLAGGMFWFDASDGPGDTLPRSIKFGIPAAFMLALATLYVPRWKAELAADIGLKVGDSSYALYLCHPFVFGLCVLVWRKLIGFGHVPLQVPLLVMLITSIVAGYLVHIWIERPILGFLHRKERIYNLRRLGPLATEQRVEN